MSNAVLAQNATQLAVSNASTPDWSDVEFTISVKNASERQAKGITRERKLLNRQKLIAAVCADYRAHFAALYGKSDRLPSAVFELIESAVDKFIVSNLNLVNTHNSISFRRAFYHNANEMEITERVQALGENKLSLDEQLLGVHIYINAANKKLDELMKKPTPDYEREKAVKQQIVKLTTTENFIKGEMEHQKKLAADTKK